MAINQKWKDTVNRGIDDARWDDYDDLIKKEIDKLNNRFSSTPQFVKLDWLFAKAMLWTESGGPENPSWNKRVMQIGNAGDPAFNVLKDGKEGSTLIMESTLQNELKTSIDKPDVNVRAAIAYLYTRLAKFEMKSIRDVKDTAIHDYKVVKDDNLASIAGKVGTTVDELISSNPARLIPLSQATCPGTKQLYLTRSPRPDENRWRFSDSVACA